MQLADHLWEHFGSRSPSDIAPDAMTVGRHNILDWFACAIAGSDDPGTVLVRDEITTASGACALIGTAQRADRRGAALANGAAGHALDYDDTSPLVGGHVTVTVLPALLAAAEELGSSLDEILHAFVIGAEVQSRIGIAMGPGPQKNGWHPSGITGPFGAAAAVAVLMGLDRDGFVAALGAAASATGGHRANFGSMTKPLHAGFAAERGLLAARLAAGGFSSHPNAVDEVLLSLGSEELVWGRVNKWADRWAVPHTLFKYHAACHLAHPGIDALRMVLDDGVAAADVEEVTVTVDSYVLGVCQFHEPTDGHQAKFSLEGALALALHGYDTAEPSAFDDEPIQSAPVQASIPNVRIETDDSLTHMQSRVSVRHAGGVSEATADLGVPISLDAQGDRLADKFSSLAPRVIGDDSAVQARDVLVEFGRGPTTLPGLLALATN